MIQTTLPFRSAARLVAIGIAMLALLGNAVAGQDDALAQVNLRDAIMILSDGPAHGISTDAGTMASLRTLLSRSENGLAAAHHVNAFVHDAVLRYALDFAIGGRRPTRTEINVLRGEIASAVASQRLIDWYKHQVPIDPAYHRLRAVYKTMTETAGNTAWPTIGGWRTLEHGSTGPRVGRLRSRLGLPVAEPAHYGAEVADAVLRYQLLHGLEADGKVGRHTLAHLDTGLDVRLAQMRTNLERHRAEWRQSSHGVGVRVSINLPSYQLTVADNLATIATMRVIIGHPDTPTPLLNEPIERLVFSPYWYVPDKIAREEILPAMVTNPSFSAINNYEVLDGRTHQPIGSDDWQAAKRPLIIRQRPGSNNALGGVKFILPNDRAVYLHDTRAPELFALSRRALSHGCIRVEKPALLASLLLDANRGWSDEAIASAMQRSSPKSVRPVVKVDVVATYFTVETLANGKTAFYEDIYGRDLVERTRMASSYIDPVPRIGDTLLASAP